MSWIPVTDPLSLEEGDVIRVSPEIREHFRNENGDWSHGAEYGLLSVGTICHDTSDNSVRVEIDSDNENDWTWIWHDGTFFEPKSDNPNCIVFEKKEKRRLLKKEFPDEKYLLATLKE
jgi:hypothetical protein